jgi:hypothetical protein
MASMTASGSICINAGDRFTGQLGIETEFITVESLSATKPDSSWTYVDKAGHFHAYDHEGKLPTLVAKEVHRPCNGACGGTCGGEGYSVTVHRCVVCNKKVQPGRVPDYGPTLIPGPTSYTLLINGPVPDDRFSFRALVGGREYFGFAERHSTTVEGGAGGVKVRSECTAWPVSWRKTGGADHG